MPYTAEQHTAHLAFVELSEMRDRAVQELIALPMGSPDLERIQGRIQGLREAAHYLHKLSQC